MRVRVLYFGVLKDLMGVEGEAVELAAGATVGMVVAGRRQRASGLAPGLASGLVSGGGEIWGSLAVAVNREYAGLGTVLREGDEVALLPPVSGGR